MQKQSPFEELSTKISLLLEKHNKTKNENIKLVNEIETLKKSLEDKNQEIEKLKEEEELRTMEIEDITKKIVNLLS
jgi:predicted  nucleic acid-binding Zn-ribbon protein